MGFHFEGPCCWQSDISWVVQSNVGLVCKRDLHLERRILQRRGHRKPHSLPQTKSNEAKSKPKSKSRRRSFIRRDGYFGALSCGQRNGRKEINLQFGICQKSNGQSNNWIGFWGQNYFNFELLNVCSPRYWKFQFFSIFFAWYLVRNIVINQYYDFSEIFDCFIYISLPHFSVFIKN